ncbi:DUF1353 domain-containing protein [bacterium]|nr:DUF1353 domain-containing protein [bacterium]
MIIHNMPVGTFLGERLFTLTEIFRFYSDETGQWSAIPIGFTCDLESIPWIRGLCRTGGIIHDFLSRYDSIPCVSKKVAADVYREALYHFGHPRWKVEGKYWAVRLAWGYFHKKSVMQEDA